MNIDIVFTWVDGNDPAWQRAKRRYMGPAQLAAAADDERWGDDTRTRNMGEIVYAVRSVRMYAPWIRRIYVVVADGQELPAMPSVIVVPHSAIMPASILPTFASSSIEPFVHRIPGLSEVFLYANDDFLFWRPTPHRFFVDGRELVLRGYRQPRLLARLGCLRRGHMRIANRTACLLYASGLRRVYMPEHSIHVMRRSTCEHVWCVHGELLEATTALKFRDDDRALFWQMLAYAYEDVLHAPRHVWSWNGCHVSFADVDKSALVRLYVRLRLRMLARHHTVCLNTIPPSWYEPMHRYLTARLGGSEHVVVGTPSRVIPTRKSSSTNVLPSARTSSTRLRT